MDQNKLISILHQIRGLVDGGMAEVGKKGAAGSKPIAHGLKRPVKSEWLSFSTNILAFMKKHARGSSGDRKFTLLLAHIAKGNASHQVSIAELERQWNKMKAVLEGKFNRAYANRAKANGWVDSPKYRMYTLSAVWKEALTKTNE